ncbi:hypothetical protein JCM10908_006403 [Rhodotorula pacifica]|uniref:BTB/POZ domain-containing protein n=1 Tax=Rhodotorula pacifica TaxID=1495444 RepID=UPI0031758939
MQTPQSSHPPSNLLQPSRPTIATHSSESTAFDPQSFGAGTSTPVPSSSPPDPTRPLTRVLPLFSKFAPLRGTVRIKVEDAVFYCHREVLALASPFFQGVLAGGWAETQPAASYAFQPTVSAQEVTTQCDDRIVEANLPFPEQQGEGLPDEPEPSASTLASHAPGAADTHSFTTAFTTSSIVEDTDEDDDDPLDATFVECRLRIHEESASSFQDLLCHIYPRLECAIHWSNVEDLCRMGLKFDIPSLTSACLAFLLPSAAGRPALCMKIAEEFSIPELYKEASRYLLDNHTGWTSEELAILDPMTLLKLERKRSWFLERLLKLGQIQMLRDYTCHSACDDHARCARLVDEKWRSAFSSAFRFGTPQPSIIYRSLRSLEPSLSSPALHLPYTACQTHAKLIVADLFDRMFGLGIQPARNWSSLAMNGASSSATPGSGNWAALRSGAGDTVSTQKNNSARYFLYVELRDDPIAATGMAERGRDNGRGASA